LGLAPRLKHQIKVRYFGWHRRGRSEYGQQFRVADVGEQAYRAGVARLSRALKRLEALGLVECYYDGYRLTPRARGMEDGLPLDRLGGGAEDQQGAVLAHIAGELRLEFGGKQVGILATTPLLGSIMKSARLLGLAMATLLGSVSFAHADGELHIFNWGDYTSPELIEKFEKEHNVKVTLTDYDSNETALAKVKEGGHGFDIVVPSANYMPIWIKDGLLLETRPDQMSNFKHIDPRWVDVDWDPGRRYSVPWQWGSAGIIVNKSVYPGDPNTSAIFMDPPAELVGKINVVPEKGDVMALAVMYVGGKPCTDDEAILKEVRDKLLGARPKWMSMDFETSEKYEHGEVGAGVTWSGAAFRSRLKNPDLVYGYPKEGFPFFMDSVAVLKDAMNVENAKLFQNFIMAPENAALISAFARFANGIQGSDAYLPADMKNAPEVSIPAAFAGKGKFNLTCPPGAQEKYTAIWKELTE
jgi:spermidine/putrescine transport system substrate-binding protein